MHVSANHLLWISSVALKTTPAFIWLEMALFRPFKIGLWLLFFFLSVCPRVTCRRSMLCCLWLQFHRLCDMVQYRVQAFCIGYKHDQSSRFKINWLSYPRNYKHGILNMQILRHVATGVAPLVIMSICSNLTCHWVSVAISTSRPDDRSSRSNIGSSVCVSHKLILGF